MTARRFNTSPTVTPARTGGDDRPRGACALDPYWFDQAAGDARIGEERNYAVVQAKAICATCPLSGIDGPCLRDNRKAPGVVAGMTHMERVQIGRVLPCGTAAAYQRHQRAGEEPCFECRIANSEYIAKKNAKRDARRRAARGAA